MNPTMVLVGTVVGRPVLVATARGETVRMLVDTGTRERDELGASVECQARHEIDLSGRHAERAVDLREGDRVVIRARLELETIADPRRTLEARGVVISISPAKTAPDRNEVLVLARLTWVLERAHREPHEPCHFQLEPVTSNELGLEPTHAESRMLRGYAFDPLASQLEALAAGAFVGLRGALSYSARWHGCQPEPYPLLLAQRWA